MFEPLTTLGLDNLIKISCADFFFWLVYKWGGRGEGVDILNNSLVAKKFFFNS